MLDSPQPRPLITSSVRPALQAISVGSLAMIQRDRATTSPPWNVAVARLARRSTVGRALRSCAKGRSPLSQFISDSSRSCEIVSESSRSCEIVSESSRSCEMSWDEYQELLDHPVPQSLFANIELPGIDGRIALQHAETSHCSSTSCRAPLKVARV